MQNIITQAQSMLDDAANQGRKTTNEVRKISSQLFKTLDDQNKDNVFFQCEKLLDTGNWRLGVIAYDWAYKVRRQYDETTFAVFDGWVKKYIKDWGDCDDFMTHAMGCLLGQQNNLFEKVMQWTKHENFAVRRSAAVSLIYPIKKDMYKKINPFLVSNTLMHDEHYLVQKGYGWMLKILSQREPDKVIKYLEKNKITMPRTAFRYALEKLDKKTRDRLMK